MMLELTNEQAVALRHALDTYRSETELERGRSDRLEWRQALRREAAVLDDVRAELACLLGEVFSPGGSGGFSVPP